MADMREPPPLFSDDDDSRRDDESEDLFASAVQVKYVFYWHYGPFCHSAVGILPPTSPY